MLQVVEGVIETSAALRDADPSAILVHVEATGLSRTARGDMHAVAREEQSRTFLAYDLLTGRVTPHHDLFPWLVRNGASPDPLPPPPPPPPALTPMCRTF